MTEKTTAMKHDGWGVRVYPYLIAISFPLCTWLNNLWEDPTTVEVGATFGLTLLFVAAADGVLRWPLRDAHGRSLWLALVVVGFFGYGHGFELLNGWVRIQHRHFAPCWVVALGLAAGGLLLIRGRRLDAAVSHFAQNTSCLLIAAQVVWVLPVGWTLFAGHDGGPPPPEPGPAVAASRAADPPRSRPDIYYVILDGYARRDVLKLLSGFDNREFLEGLESRGFYVASGARSNYSQTRLSLASSLSMDYLPPTRPEASSDLLHQQIRRLRKHGRVVGRLRELGYRYRYVGSMYFPVDAAADEELSPSGAGRTYVRAFLATTALQSVERALRLGGYLQDPVGINEFQFRAIARAKCSRAPLYTFAHVACPHEPYVYDRHGPLPQPIPADEATASDYVAQLQYLNRRVLELIDAIDRTSGPEAVVLLQADHGSDLPGRPGRPDAVGLFERMSIFSAYRCPARVRQRLYPTITPVNSFRVLLGGLFGDDLPLLEDRSFYSRYEAPFDFIEVAPQGPSSCAVSGAGQPATDLVAGDRSIASNRLHSPKLDRSPAAPR